MSDIYLIAHLFEGEVKKTLEGIIEEVADKWKIVPETAKIPPHLTLKRPFKHKDISVVEDRLKHFSKNIKSASVEVEGFDHFGRQVIFADIKPSEETKEILRKFDEEMNNIPNLSLEEFDKKRRLHATIAREEIEPFFDEMWDFVKNKNLKMEIRFNNIGLLQKTKGEPWRVVKKYTLK